jgi:hypothetical protein
MDDASVFSNNAYHSRIVIDDASDYDSDDDYECTDYTPEAWTPVPGFTEIAKSMTATRTTPLDKVSEVNAALPQKKPRLCEDIE